MYTDVKAGKQMDMDTIRMRQKENLKQRNSNLELMRIFLMAGMIAHHYVVNSGVEELYDFSSFSGETFFLQIFGMFGKTGINCFTLLSGYFMVRSNITLKKFLKLYLEVKFYYLGFYLLFFVTGYEPFSVSSLKAAVFNVLYELNWLYTGTYLVFFLLIPFLNVLAHRLSEKQYRYMLLLGCCYYTLVSTFTGADTFSYLGWMGVMYLLGAYLACYGKRFPVYHSLRLSAAGLLVSFLLMCFSVLAIDLWGTKNGFDEYYFFVHDSHKILALTTSVFLFLTFLNLKLKPSVFINRIASSTFGILLIHTNSGAMRRFLWQDLFDVREAFEQGNIVGHAVLAVVTVFAAACLIDWGRIRWVERPLFHRLYQKKWMIRLEEKVNELWRTNKREQNS